MTKKLPPELLPQPDQVPPEIKDAVAFDLAYDTCSTMLRSVLLGPNGAPLPILTPAHVTMFMEHPSVVSWHNIPVHGTGPTSPARYAAALRMLATALLAVRMSGASGTSDQMRATAALVARAMTDFYPDGK